MEHTYKPLQLRIAPLLKRSILSGAAEWPHAFYASLWNGREIDYQARKPAKSRAPALRGQQIDAPLLTGLQWIAIPCAVSGVAFFFTDDPAEREPFATVSLPAWTGCTVTITPGID